MLNKDNDNLRKYKSTNKLNINDVDFIFRKYFKTSSKNIFI